MHELSVASEIVKVAIREAEKRGAKQVKSVHLIVGRLTHLSKEQLTFCYNILKRDNILKGSRLVITEQEPKVECSSCGYIGSIGKVSDDELGLWAVSLSCPKCGEPVKIKEGLECRIKAIKMVIP
ncbi:MAG: hydrogenase maturation nickel metallochaperone HypA [Nitrososphaerales archaeon]